MKITFKQSPNYTKGRKGYKPELIVCHITDGAYNGAVSWLCNRASQASAHFVVSKKGEVTQLVDLRDYSWCNGTSTCNTAKNYYGKSTNSIVKAKKTNANYYSVSIELEGTTASTNGRLTDAQYDALVELIKYIQSQVKKIYGNTIPFDRNHIIGHNEVAPITKPFCPGTYFPWTALMSSLNPKVTAVNVEKMRVDSTPISINKNGTQEIRDVYRVLYEGTNFLKLRDICNIAGAEVGYVTRPIIKIKHPVTIPAISLNTANKSIDKLVIDVEADGKASQVVVNSILVDGTNYVKMRDVCAILGAEVGYDSAKNLPLITL